MAHTIFQRAQVYVGTPYVEGEFVCADLAVQVQRELFGRLVAMPALAQRPSSVTRADGSSVARLRDALADPVETPDTGHAALFWTPEGDGQDLRRWHVGTVFVHGGEIWVLHNSATLGSAALQRLADLQRWGMRLEGFYAWRAAA